MALPVDFKSIVTRLDAGSLTELVSRLLQAEANLLGMPGDAVVVSDALTESDGGLDARIDDVPTTSQHIPAGLNGFQFKARKTKAVSALGLADELAKPGPKRILENGGTYILVWQADLNDRQRNAAEKALAAEVGVIRAGGNWRIWDASAIVALADRHVAVVEALELVEFGVVRGLPELEDALRVQDRPYESDPERVEAIAQIRERAEQQSDDPTVVTVSGLAGTGKTRLVLESLNADGLRDVVLYANSADGLHTFVARIVRDSRTRGILVVDELAESDQKAIYERLAATKGRWRLVAIVPQTSRRYRSAGARDVLLAPLSPEATRRLIEATSGLSESQARTVADAAKGFPELAFRLAEELQADPNLDLLRLAHLERPNEVLRRALPEESLRRALKPLALFTGLGVEGDLAYQLDSVAQAFGHDPARMRHEIDLELSRRRFVSAAGRYRSVSPTLVAIWLAIELIDETPELDKIVSRLPEPVQEAFYEQLELFGPEARQLGPALGRLLDDERFRDPKPFDEAAGRFLRASAAVIPTQVAASIDSLVGSATADQLAEMPRRDLVWALEILRWWPGTWETAIRNLFRLAQEETETWANNATGTFKESFTVYLSGSTVPFRDRIAWLEQVSREANRDQLPMLAEAAAMGLERHHTRSVVGFRGGGEPQDWQPATVKELREARSRAWDELIGIIDRLGPESRSEEVKRLNQGLITLVVEGLVDRVATDLQTRDWTRPERAEFIATLNSLSRYEEFPEDVAATLTALRDWLQGSDLAERLSVVLATPVWELYERDADYESDPPALVELADRVASAPDGVAQALETGIETANPNTRFQFLRLIALRVGATELGNAVLRDPLDIAAAAAALSVADGQGSTAWADETLEWVRREAPSDVPLLVTYPEVTPERLSRALDVIDDGRADPGPLVNLRGGGRVLLLPGPVADRLLCALERANYFEGALGIAQQFVEAAAADVPAWLRERAWQIAKDALASESDDTMVDYHITKLVEAGVFDPDQLVQLWASRMRHRAGLVEQLDRVLTERSLDVAPERTLNQVVALIRDEASGNTSFSLFASRDLALLSRVAAQLGVDPVWDAIAALDDREFRVAIHHMEWAGHVPEGLVARFLGSLRLAGFESEAYTTFFNVLGVVSGDYWRALDRERDRARAWRDALQEPQARLWAEELVKRYDHDVEWHRAREEEEDFRLGG